MLNSKEERNTELKKDVSDAAWVLYLYSEKGINTVNRRDLLASNKDDTGINKNVPSNTYII